MLSLRVLTFVLLGTACLAAPAPNDQYADLINDVLTFIKQQLTAHEPMVLPDVKNQEVKTLDVDLMITQTNTQVSKASTFGIQKVATDPTTLTAQVALEIPEFELTANYEVSGEAYGHKVSGSGEISVSLSNFVQEINATFENPDTSLQLSQFGLGYELDGLKVNVGGLQIEGMTPAQVSAFIDETVPKIIFNQKAQVEQTVSAVLQSRINAMISGKTLPEVAAWVKSLIQPQ